MDMPPPSPSLSLLSSSAPAVLLHSGGMSSRQWRLLHDTLAVDRVVVTPDFIGCGADAAFVDDPAFDFKDDVDRIAHVVTNLGEPVHLVGHSYGGLVALCVARRLPMLVRSLCVYEPVALGVLHDANDVEGLGDLEHFTREPIFSDEARGGGADWLQAFVDYWNGAGSWQALSSSSREEFMRVGRKAFREAQSLGRDRTTAAGWSVIEAPTLVLTGKQTPVAARRVCELIAAALPAAQLVRIEGAGHMGPLTHADVVNAAIAAQIAASSTR